MIEKIEKKADSDAVTTKINELVDALNKITAIVMPVRIDDYLEEYDEDSPYP
jgi:hypothetical protein